MVLTRSHCAGVSDVSLVSASTGVPMACWYASLWAELLLPRALHAGAGVRFTGMEEFVQQAAAAVAAQNDDNDDNDDQRQGASSSQDSAREWGGGRWGDETPLLLVRRVRAASSPLVALLLPGHSHLRTHTYVVYHSRCLISCLPPPLPPIVRMQLSKRRRVRAVARLQRCRRRAAAATAAAQVLTGAKSRRAGGGELFAATRRVSGWSV